MCLVNLDDQVLQIAPNVCKKGAKRQIHEQFVNQRVIKLEYCQYNNSSRIFDHCLSMIEKFARDGQKGEVVSSCVHEKFYSCMVDTECQGLEEGNEGVYKLLIVKVEFEAD